LNSILESLIKIVNPAAIVLRLARRISEAEAAGLQDGQVLYGDLPNPVVRFVENGILFQADVVKGHKTGFFFDQRDNRAKVRALARDRHVLDVFCYSGGFTVSAFMGAQSRS
jgi:23S rRNA (cytosine1962-C5)-methyltransferase